MKTKLYLDIDHIGSNEISLTKEEEKALSDYFRRKRERKNKSLEIVNHINKKIKTAEFK